MDILNRLPSYKYLHQVDILLTSILMSYQWQLYNVAHIHILGAKPKKLEKHLVFISCVSMNEARFHAHLFISKEMLIDNKQ